MTTTPFKNPELYRSIVFGGVRSPGTVTLSGHDRNEDWEIKPAKGQTGASTTRNGQPVAQFTATVYVVDNDPIVDQFAELEKFRATVRSTTAGKTPVALPIQHPDLAAQGITQATNAGIGGLVHDGKGGATQVFKFLEFKPAKKVTGGKPKAKQTGKSADADAQKIADVMADGDAELDKLLKTAQEP